MHAEGTKPQYVPNADAKAAVNKMLEIFHDISG